MARHSARSLLNCATLRISFSTSLIDAMADYTEERIWHPQQCIEEAVHPKEMIEYEGINQGCKQEAKGNAVGVGEIHSAAVHKTTINWTLHNAGVVEE